MDKKRRGRRQSRPQGWGVRPQQVESWLDRAQTHLMNEAYERVVQTARLVVRHVPEGSEPYAQANYLLGAALGMLQDFEGSREAYSRTLEAEPDNASAWYNRALSNRFLLRTGEALRDVERAIELEQRPAHREVYGEERAFLRHIVEKHLAMLPLYRETGPPDTMRIEDPWRARELGQSMEFFFEQEES